MSLNSIINYARTGLFTAQAALRTTSNNIANVNTPGYARERVIQEATVSGSQAGGVRISGIERVVDQFLVRSKRDADSRYAFHEIAGQFHDRIQALLGRPDENNSLTGRMTEIFSAFSKVALTPQSVVLKEAAIVSINRFGEEISGLATEIQRLRLDASSQVAEKITRINALTKRISDLNPLIIKETVTNGAPGALEQQRANAIDELATLIDIGTRPTGQGGIYVTTSQGIGLVGVVRSVLKYNPPGTVTSGTVFPPITVHNVDRVSGEIGPATQVVNGALVSGQLTGLLQLRDTELPEIARELGNLSSEFIDQINAAHNLNSSAPAPNSLVGKNTGLLPTDNHNFTGETVFAVTDSDGKLINKVTIDFTAIGSTVADLVTAVNAGLGGSATLSMSNGVMSFTGTGATNSVAIAEDGVTPSNRGGRSFSHFFGMNDLVEARIPNHFDSGFAGTDGHNFTAGGMININITNKHGIVLENYTMTVTGTSFNDLVTDLNASNLSGRVNFSLDANGALVVTSVPAAANYNLEVVSDTTSRTSTNISMSGLFGLGIKYQSDSAFNLQVKDSIKSNPGSLGLAKFNHTGAVGDVVLSVGDQKGANALQNIENNVLNFEASGGLGKMNATINQYAAALLADIGLRSQLNDGYREDNKALTNELSQRVSDYSGVNLDEELGNIIIYQNAYSASARLITTAKELYDELLRLI